MSSSVKAQELAVSTGSTPEAIALMRSKPELLKCLTVSNIDADIIEDVADTCEINGIDALTLASGVLSAEEIEHLLYLTLAEAQVLAQNCKVAAFNNGVKFGATHPPEPVSMKNTPASSMHGNGNPREPTSYKRDNDDNSDSLDFSGMLENIAPPKKSPGQQPKEGSTAAKPDSSTETVEQPAVTAEAASTTEAAALPEDAPEANNETTPAAEVTNPVKVIASADNLTEYKISADDSATEAELANNNGEKTNNLEAAPTALSKQMPPPLPLPPLKDASQTNGNLVSPNIVVRTNPAAPVPATPEQSKPVAASESALDSPRLPICSDDVMSGPMAAFMGADSAKRSAPRRTSRPESATPAPRGSPLKQVSKPRPTSAPPKKSPRPEFTLSPTPPAAALARPPSAARSSYTFGSFSNGKRADVGSTSRNNSSSNNNNSNTRSQDDMYDGTFLKYPGEMPAFMRPTVAAQMRMRRATEEVETPPPKRPPTAVPKIQPMSNLVRATASSAAKAEQTPDPIRAASPDVRSASTSTSRRGAKPPHVTVQVPFRLRTALRPSTRELSSDELAVKNAIQQKQEEEKRWNAKLKRATRQPAAHAARGPTKFEPFNLTSLQLHEKELGESLKRLKAQREAESKARVFKARPFDLQALSQREATRRSAPQTPPTARKLTVPKGPTFLSDMRIGYHHDVLEGKFRDTHEAYVNTQKLKAQAKQAEVDAKAEAIRKQYKFVARSMPDFSQPFYPDPNKVAPITKPHPPQLATSIRSNNSSSLHLHDTLSVGSSTPRIASPHGTTSDFAMSLRS